MTSNYFDGSGGLPIAKTEQELYQRLETAIAKSEIGNLSMYKACLRSAHIAGSVQYVRLLRHDRRWGILSQLGPCDIITIHVGLLSGAQDALNHVRENRQQAIGDLPLLIIICHMDQAPGGSDACDHINFAVLMPENFQATVGRETDDDI